jgi:hypothetical protein
MGIRKKTQRLEAYKLQSFNELSSHAWFQMAGCAAFSVHGKQSLFGFGLGTRDNTGMYGATEKSIEITVVTLRFEIGLTFYPADEIRCLLRVETKSKPITN